jgi:catechol 2,3-dioxygenase-like lactoylglutathione lyase family enzyme
MSLRRAGLLLLTAGLLAMAVKPRRTRLQALRILRISRVVADLNAAETFYRDALAFETISRQPVDAATCSALGLAAAEEVVMRLGDDRISLVQSAAPGSPYPPDSRSNDLWFQHLAIVVSDMDAAYAHLTRGSPTPQGAGDWQPISLGGPRLLPPANGAVRAFKFRDPDGHPLELIWFPPGQGRAIWRHDNGLFLGIDHSAISVGSGLRSHGFYRGLGMRVSARSLNQGAAQSALDGLPDARVRVIGLRPTQDSGPGLELLAYQPPGRQIASAVNDHVTDWVTIEVSSLPGDRLRVMRDPDGHLLLLVDQTTPPFDGEKSS